MEIALLPCPFCGDDDILPVYEDSHHAWNLCCGVCGARIEAATESEAIEHWNTRPDPRTCAESQTDRLCLTETAPQQPDEKPNVLRAIIANDVMIRNLIHETPWQKDPAVQLVLADNIRLIQIESNRSSKRESIVDVIPSTTKSNAASTDKP